MKLAKLIPFLLCAMLAAGCSRGSRFTGTWTGLVKPGAGQVSDILSEAMKGPSTLTMNPDGTGFLKIAGLPEEPISWKEEGEKVILQVRGTSSSQSAQGTIVAINSSQLQTLVGTLGKDGQTLRIDLGQVAVDMDKTSG